MLSSLFKHKKFLSLVASQQENGLFPFILSLNELTEISKNPAHSL